jgi:hypothetical protein
MSVPRIFNDENDQLLWSTASALKHMVASNHIWGNEAWQTFKKELKSINDCIAHVEENQRLFGKGKS